MWKQWDLSWEHTGLLHNLTGLHRIVGRKISSREINELDQSISEACQRRKHVAIKTVRVPDIGYLESMVSDPKLNVKIIYLVRDPRARVVSRRHFKHQPDECDVVERNLRYWTDPPDWLKGRHMVLRYEDLADDHIRVTQQIYNIMGLGEIPEAVTKWLDNNTKRNNPLHYTTRNSKIAANAWRKKIDFTRMLQVQERCKVVLSMLGYEALRSRADLHNDKVQSLKKVIYPFVPS